MNWMNRMISIKMTQLFSFNIILKRLKCLTQLLMECSWIIIIIRDTAKIRLDSLFKLKPRLTIELESWLKMNWINRMLFDSANGSPSGREWMIDLVNFLADCFHDWDEFKVQHHFNKENKNFKKFIETMGQPILPICKALRTAFRFAYSRRCVPCQNYKIILQDNCFKLFNLWIIIFGIIIMRRTEPKFRQCVKNNELLSAFFKSMWGLFRWIVIISWMILFC